MGRRQEVREGKRVSPIAVATDARGEIAKAIQTGGQLRLKLPRRVAACLIGLSAEDCGIDFNLWIRGGEEVSVLAIDDRELATEALRVLRDTEEPPVTAHFAYVAYFALFRSVQAAFVDSDLETVSPEDGLILDVLAEQHSVCEGLKGVLAGGTGLPPDDFGPVQLLADQLWKRMPEEIRQAKVKFHPENLFSQL